MKVRRPHRDRLKVGVVTSHPIQYQAPWFRALAERLDLHVYFAQKEIADKIAAGGYGMRIEWDIDLFGGYASSFLNNVSTKPFSDGYGSCDTPGIAALLAAEQYDAVIVNGWYLKSYVQTIVACRRQGIPVLVRGDSRLMPSMPAVKRLVKRVGYPILLRAFAGCLYVGQENREYLEHYGVPAPKLFHVPHSVDNARFSERAEAARLNRAQLRRELGFAEHEIIALFVGRLMPVKRPQDLIAALERLPASANVRAAYVGTGPLEQDITERARRAGLDVKMLGFRNQNELPTIYAAADFLVLPSEHETWGLVVNEAMACGIPAIVSDTVGCRPDLITAGQTGEFYPVGEAEGLAAAIRRLLPRLGTDTLREALDARMKRYSVARAVEGTLEALRSVTA